MVSRWKMQEQASDTVGLLSMQCVFLDHASALRAVYALLVPALISTFSFGCRQGRSVSRQCLHQIARICEEAGQLREQYRMEHEPPTKSSGKSAPAPTP